MLWYVGFWFLYMSLRIYISQRKWHKLIRHLTRHLCWLFYGSDFKVRRFGTCQKFYSFMTSHLYHFKDNIRAQILATIIHNSTIDFMPVHCSFVRRIILFSILWIRIIAYSVYTRYIHNFCVILRNDFFFPIIRNFLSIKNLYAVYNKTDIVSCLIFVVKLKWNWK